LTQIISGNISVLILLSGAVCTYLMLSESTTQNNSISNHDSLQVIVKILNSDNAINHALSTNKNHDIPFNTRISKRIHFAICNSCYWCASLFLDSSIKCPICESDRNVEVIPISKNESFKISHDPKAGIILAFS
jgi:hypothetical protein